MKEPLIYKMLKTFFIIFLLVFIVYFLKSGYYISVRVKHDMHKARATCDKFMLLLKEKEFDSAYNLFYSSAKQLGKREEFKRNLSEALGEFGNFEEIIFIAAYPQTNGPYLGMHYKSIHKHIMGVDYFFLLLKEDKKYSIYQFIFGKSGTFYPDFSFKKEIKGNPVIIYQKKQ